MKYKYGIIMQVKCFHVIIALNLKTNIHSDSNEHMTVPCDSTVATARNHFSFTGS